MDLQQAVQIQQSQLKFCYKKNEPNTLTITKKPHKILESLSEIAKIIWVIEDLIEKQNILEKIKRIKVGQKFQFAFTIEQTKSVAQKSQIVAIVCNQSILIDVINLYKNTTAHIMSIFSYGFDKQFQQIEDPPCIYQQETLQDVLQKIQQRQFYLNKQKEQPYFISVQKQILDSNILVLTMFAMINQETNKQQLIKELGELAKLVVCPEDYDQIQQFLDFQLSQESNDYKKTIQWYTKQSFVYGLVNGVLRCCKQPTSIFILQPYFRDLWLAIKKIYELQQQNQVEKRGNGLLNLKRFRCFRGGKITEQQYKFIRQHQNKIIQNLGFLSTSVDKEKAIGFVKNVLYEIEVETEPRNAQLDFGFGYIAQFAHIATKHEQQVLFNPLNTFKVVEVGYYDLDQNIYKIKLKYGQLARITAKSPLNLKQEELKYKYLGDYQNERKKTKCQGIGNVLIGRNENLQGSLQYLDKYIQISEQSGIDEFIIHGYFQKGVYTFNQGKKYQEMMNYYQKSLMITKNNKNLQTKQVQILFRIGLGLIKIGKNKQAIQYLSRSEEIQKRVKGQKNSKYGKILLNIGICYQRVGKYQEAIQLLQRSRSIMKQINSQNNPDFADIIFSLANCYSFLGQYTKQVNYLLQCKDIIENTLGNKHHHYVITLCSLGGCYQKLGRYKKSLQYLKKSEEFAKQVLKPNHNDFTIIYYSLGSCYQKLGQFNKAFQYIQQCKKINRSVLGQKNPGFAAIQRLHGYCLYRKGDYKQAIQYLQKSQQIYKNTLGQNHMSTSITYNFLGRCCLSLGFHQRALEYFEKCQKKLKLNVGQNHFEYALVLHSFGKYYLNLGKQHIAIDYLKKCQQIQLKILGQNHFQYSLTLQTLGSCFINLRLFDQAFSYLEKAISIQNSSGCQKNPDYAVTLFILGQCYGDMGQFEKAIEIMESVKKTQEETIGKDHPFYNITIQNISTILQRISKKHKKVDII